METVQRNPCLLQEIGFADTKRSRVALDILLVNRRSEFRELAESILQYLQEPIVLSMWDEFILAICLDVKESFDSWSGRKYSSKNSDLKTLIILQQFGKGKTTMTQLTRLLDLAYAIAEEFRIIYERVD